MSVGKLSWRSPGTLLACSAWEDRSKLVHESGLCDVLPLFERCAALDAERKEAERLRQFAARERREHEDVIALEAFKQQVHADRLLTDLNAWELAGRLRAYLGVLRERVEAMTANEERGARRRNGWSGASGTRPNGTQRRS